MEYSALLPKRLNLAKTYRAIGNNTEAEKIYREIIADSTALKAENYGSLPVVANNYAYLLKEEGKYSKAENYYRLALSSHINIFGDNHPTSLMLMSNLAEIYARQDKFKEAEKLLQKRLELIQVEYGNSSWQLGSAYESMGILYYENGVFEQAQNYFLEAVEIFTHSLGELHVWTIRANLHTAYSILETEPMRNLSEIFEINYESLEIASGQLSYNFRATLTNMIERLKKSDKNMSYHINRLNKIIELSAEY